MGTQQAQQHHDLPGLLPQVNFMFCRFPLDQHLAHTECPLFSVNFMFCRFPLDQHLAHMECPLFSRSVMTGTESPIHHTPWLDALDDSKQCYLASSRDEAEAIVANRLAATAAAVAESKL
jgi:hypothetical protein